MELSKFLRLSILWFWQAHLLHKSAFCLFIMPSWRFSRGDSLDTLVSKWTLLTDARGVITIVLSFRLCDRTVKELYGFFVLKWRLTNCKMRSVNSFVTGAAWTWPLLVLNGSWSSLALNQRSRTYRRSPSYLNSWALEDVSYPSLPALICSTLLIPSPHHHNNQVKNITCNNLVQSKRTFHLRTTSVKRYCATIKRPHFIWCQNI